MRAVLKKASWGTRRIFRSIRCKKQASTVRKGYSVPKTAFSGTRRIFKGALNSLLLHRMHFRKRKNGILSHRTHLQRPAEQPIHRLWTSSWGARRIFRGVPCQKQHLPHRTHLQCAKRLRSEVIRLKRGRPLSLSRLFGQSLTSMVLSGVRRLLIACL